MWFSYHKIFHNTKAMWSKMTHLQLMEQFVHDLVVAVEDKAKM
jgi:hypothetical protein